MEEILYLALIVGFSVQSPCRKDLYLGHTIMFSTPSALTSSRLSTLVTTSRASLLAVCGLVTSCLVACGSGGGGGDSDFVGAATVNVRVSPDRIDTGDQTLVSILISDINDRGIALKVRFPTGLRYVPRSGSLEANNESTLLTPTVEATSSRESDNYLVFYLSQEQFQPSGRDYNGETGTLTIRLQGSSGVRDGLIEVDPDVDDPDIDNAQEFSIEEPEFSAEDAVSIEVTD